MREWIPEARSRAWFAVGLFAVVLCALACPSPSAAQATDGSDEAEADDADATETDAAPADAADEPAPSSGEGASALGEGTSAGDGELESGDVAAEEAAAAPAEEEAAAPPPREPLPWRNSFFSWTHGVTANSFVRDGQLSYNPVYYWSFNLAPRWYIDPATFFFVSQSLSYELTDSDGGSPYNRDVLLGDTLVELRRVAVVEGFIFIPAVRLVLPVSKLSQAAQRYFGLGAGLTAVRVIPEAASLTIALIGRYQYWFAGRNTPATMGAIPAEGAPNVPMPPVGGPEGIGPTLDQASASTSFAHIVTAGLALNVTPVQGLTISASAFWLATEGFGLAPACVRVGTSMGGFECFNDASATHWRHFTYLTAAVAYDVQPWLNLSISWANSTILAPFFNDDTSVRSPFNPDNNFMLTASIQIDTVFEALQGGEDDGLTPEQRQRRRQGLSRRITGEEGSF